MPKNRIHKLTDGRFCYANTDAMNKRYKIVSRKGESKPAFTLRCEELDMKCGSDISVVNLTFRELHRRWIDDKYGDTESSDKNRMIQSYKYFVEPKIGHLKLLDITRPAIYQLLLDVRNKGYSDSVISKARGTISRPYAWAQNTLMLNIPDVISGIRLPKRIATDTSSKPISYFTKEDEKRFFDVCDSKYWAYFKLLLLTGMRPSEALGLQWGDIKDGYINIRRGITAYELSKLKSKNAHRSIPITDKIQTVIDTISKENEWLFPSRSGIPSINAVTQAFKRTRAQTAKWKKEGRVIKAKLITPPIEHTMYDFRHTFGTRMAESGMPDYVLANIMGHSDISVTKLYYIGITDTMVNDAKMYMENI